MKLTNKITELVNDLNNGKVVCFKTDTIWGLSANPYNKQAMQKLYTIKQRDASKPFIFLIKNSENIETFTNDLTSAQKELVKNLWPGPISIIVNFNNNTNLLNFYQNKTTIALRKPKSNICQKILNNLDFPLPSTSVNIEGQPPINTLEGVKIFLKDEDVTILNCKDDILTSQSSTLIKFENNNIEILRKGNLPKKILDLLKI